MCIRDSLLLLLVHVAVGDADPRATRPRGLHLRLLRHQPGRCLLYTSDAADERSSVDLGGRRIIKKKIMPIHG